MDYMLESSLTIGDEVLQKELSMNADEKMRNTWLPSSGNKISLSET
jgi:DNA helicase IV